VQLNPFQSNLIYCDVCFADIYWTTVIYLMLTLVFLVMAAGHFEDLLHAVLTNVTSSFGDGLTSAIEGAVQCFNVTLQSWPTVFTVLAFIQFAITTVRRLRVS
jgi:hypothetical protein